MERNDINHGMRAEERGHLAGLHKRTFATDSAYFLLLFENWRRWMTTLAPERSILMWRRARPTSASARDDDGSGDNLTVACGFMRS